jgi:hypothetical protein
MWVYLEIPGSGAVSQNILPPAAMASGEAPLVPGSPPTTASLAAPRAPPPSSSQLRTPPPSSYRLQRVPGVVVLPQQWSTSGSIGAQQWSLAIALRGDATARAGGACSSSSSGQPLPLSTPPPSLPLVCMICRRLSAWFALSRMRGKEKSCGWPFLFSPGPESIVSFVVWFSRCSFFWTLLWRYWLGFRIHGPSVLGGISEMLFCLQGSLFPWTDSKISTQCMSEQVHEMPCQQNQLLSWYLVAELNHWNPFWKAFGFLRFRGIGRRKYTDQASI